jgi:hypothetical protein
MPGPPAWLVPLIVVDPWNENTFEVLYAVFERDFKHTRPTLEGHEVWFFPELDDGREAIFWHLTHRKDKATGERLPDPRRCERLGWVRCMFNNCAEQEILFWDYLESDGTTHSYLWLKDHDFAVILKKYPNGARRLVTSYYVDQRGTKKTFEQKYQKRVKN